ncbi:15642_t:CDS:2 [Racocetra persica]|uniref:15642_t:CDS:1 n=1 Tax=Racocetra persica TaxID=160502 RepID=A0ACA9MZT5_9GLOM|nr:15642_t:CDS:2 [Racocetra persica]
MTKKRILQRNNAEWVGILSQRNILIDLSDDIMQLDMSGKATQKADSKRISIKLIDQLFSDNNKEENWKDIYDDKSSKYSENDNLTNQFINFDASKNEPNNNGPDEPKNN